MSTIKTESITTISLLGITVLAGILLTLPSALADDSVVTDVAITVPVACAVTSTVGTAHTASIDSGTYQDDIGTTTIKTTCNDSQGFSIYAIGYTNEEYGNTTLKPSVLDATQNSIITGTATSGATSNWAMKLTASTGMTSTNILSDDDGAYSDYHKVPTTYTKVVTMASNTNATTGASIDATYAVYISGDQPADIYTGKVKYTMVHPANEQPLQPQTSGSGQICYYANASGYEGTMGCQTISDYAKDWSQCVNGTDYSSYCYNSGYTNIVGSLPSTNNPSFPLLASNFSRDGYGFAGWSDKFDYATNANAHFYGPQETITIPDTSIYTGEGKGLSLYAVWVKSQGNLQDADKVATLCGTGTGSLTKADEATSILSQSITALSDARDNNTYAIAKLADGKCWMIENLRLDNTAEHNTDGTLAQGYDSSFIGLADAESEHFSDSDTTANSLYTTEADVANKNTISGYYQAYRFPRYNNLNTKSRAQNSPSSNTFSSNNADGGMYSYGNYYTWHAAIADLTYNSTNNSSVTNTSLCPTGWRLPQGGNKTRIESNDDNDFWNLTVDALNGGTNPANYDSSTQPYYTGTPEGTDASNKLRAYPNNFLYSGYFYSSSADYRGSNGSYWSSTARNSNDSYLLDLNSSFVSPGTNYYYKFNGYSIRCVSGS